MSCDRNGVGGSTEAVLPIAGHTEFIIGGPSEDDGVLHSNIPRVSVTFSDDDEAIVKVCDMNGNKVVGVESGDMEEHVPIGPDPTDISTTDCDMKGSHDNIHTTPSHDNIHTTSTPRKHSTTRSTNNAQTHSTTHSTNNTQTHSTTHSTNNTQSQNQKHLLKHFSQHLRKVDGSKMPTSEQTCEEHLANSGVKRPLLRPLMAETSTIQQSFEMEEVSVRVSLLFCVVHACLFN